MLEAMVAQFCGERKIYLRALKSGYKMLARQSELSASVWRDTVILQPLVRAAIIGSVPTAPEVTRNIESVGVRADRQTAFIEVPKWLSGGWQLRLDIDLKRVLAHKNFKEAREVARVFGIS
jgi:hypothetical protein